MFVVEIAKFVSVLLLAFALELFTLQVQCGILGHTEHTMQLHTSHTYSWKSTALCKQSPLFIFINEQHSTLFPPLLGSPLVGGWWHPSFPAHLYVSVKTSMKNLGPTNDYRIWQFKMVRLSTEGPLIYKVTICHSVSLVTHLTFMLLLSTMAGFIVLQLVHVGK